MKTYEFIYDENIDDFGSVQFCAESRSEAKDLFKEWQMENGYNITEYSINVVYNHDDARVYGSRYKCFA